MKKFDFFLIISIIMIQDFFSPGNIYSAQATSPDIQMQPNPDRGIPSALVKKLFQHYKNLQFDEAESYLTGNMAKYINNIKRYLLEANLSDAEKIKNRFKSLSEIRIYNEFITDNYARVDSLWVYRSPPDSPFYFKAKDMAFLLVKINGKWYIKSSKFRGEHILHNTERILKIRRQVERERENQSRNNTRTQNRR